MSTPQAHEPAATETFLEGVRLFNDGHYWHAHEQWEVCWLASTEPEATFYKGIIQAAAALVHWQRENQRGLRRNWAKSRPKLVAVSPGLRGLDVTRLICEMDRFVLCSGATPAPRLRVGPAPD
jgi:predicted metal-dependent hydrolase